MNNDKNPLARLTLQNLKMREHARGLAWSATLLLDGEPVLTVEGNGGCCRYSPPPVHRDFARARLTQRRLDKAANSATGLRVGALDMLVSCMTPSINGAS